MTEIIKDVQKQDPGSRIITLFELELDTNITDDSYAYFHNSLEGDLTTIQFRTATANSTTGKYDAKEYQALPVGAKGFETGGGPSARPTFTIANVLSTFSDQLDGLTNDDLLGKKLIRRSTLYKYCVGQSGDSGENSDPIEFPKETWYIDRIASENPITVTFELVSPFDLEGTRLPARTIIGGVCSWKYQGASADLSEGDRVGGCNWNTFSRVDYEGTVYTNFVNREDEPVLSNTLAPTSNYTTDAAITINYIYRQQKTGLEVIQPDGTIVANDDTNNPVYDYWQATATISSNAGAPSDENPNFRRVRFYKDYNSTSPGSEWVYAYTNILYNEYMIGSDPNDKRSLESHPRLFKVKNRSQRGGKYQPNGKGFPQMGNYWERADICGKSLNSCMQRYQYAAANIDGSSNKGPNVDRAEHLTIRFGGFPSSRKYGR
mgnify:CR=1 FL=1